METRHLASVGIHFISLWKVNEDCEHVHFFPIPQQKPHLFLVYAASLTQLPTTKDPSEFIPRFVRFTDNGSRLLIGYMESHEV